MKYFRFTLCNDNGSCVDRELRLIMNILMKGLGWYTILVLQQLLPHGSREELLKLG